MRYEVSDISKFHHQRLSDDIGHHPAKGAEYKHTGDLFWENRVENLALLSLFLATHCCWLHVFAASGFRVVLRWLSKQIKESEVQRSLGEMPRTNCDLNSYRKQCSKY
jgi:hypothetical protein